VLSSVRNLLPALILVMFLVGSVWAACPDGDVYDDCRVDWFDLKFLADHWLDPAGSPADIVGDDGVDIADFAKLASKER